jgi:hypothetical protein
MPDRCGAQNVGLLKPTCNASRRVILVCPVTARESGNLSSVPVFPVCENRSLPAGLFHRVVKVPRSAHQPEHKNSAIRAKGIRRRERRGRLEAQTSVITSKPANGYHFKTGQRNWPSRTITNLLNPLGYGHLSRARILFC